MTEQSQTKHNGKLLLACQWWAGDAPQMLELLRLIADMEDGKSQTADVMLFPRRDCKTRDMKVFDFLKVKFDKVHFKRSTRPNSGWPFGPNAVAMDVFRSVHQDWKAGIFDYEAVLLVEADCVPTRKGWTGELLQEWRDAQRLAIGHWDGSASENPPGGHMNGNMMFHPNLVDHVPELAYGEVPHWGWDMKFWPAIRPFATPSRKIYSDYKLNTPSNPLKSPLQIFGPKRHNHPQNPFVGQDLYPCWLHGVKGLDGIKMARAKILH